MNDAKFDVTTGARVFGAGILALGILGLVLGNFDPGQSVPRGFPARALLAYVAAMFLLAAGAAMQWRRAISWAAAALAVYYAVLVVLLMNGRVILAHYTEFGAYSGTAEQLAIAAGALIVYARYADIDAGLARRLTHLAQIVFGVCAVLFGLAHFVYMELTAPLVPAWLPPSQQFWGYATGAAQIAAGIALLTGVRARLAVSLLTVLYVIFQVLVHLRMLLAEPSNHDIWSENALNLALIGVAWVMAESLSGAPRAERPMAA